ncbi:hypothetical protein V6C27_00535 [Peptococcaceae bacterium 1198_IL3148]
MELTDSKDNDTTELPEVAAGLAETAATAEPELTMQEQYHFETSTAEIDESATGESEHIIDTDIEEANAEDDIQDSYSNEQITSSITSAEPELPMQEQYHFETATAEIEESSATESEHVIGTDIEEANEEAVMAEEPEAINEELEQTTTEVIEPVVEVLTVQQLVSKGLSQSRLGNYNDAVKLLMEALKQQPEPMLKYLAVSEISTIYQHLGIYQFAANLLVAYIKESDLQQHPGLKAWREKLVYLNIMIDLLKENKLPSLPYNQVPDFIKKKAFSMTLEKISK